MPFQSNMIICRKAHKKVKYKSMIKHLFFSFMLTEMLTDFRLVASCTFTGHILYKRTTLGDDTVRPI